MPRFLPASNRQITAAPLSAAPSRPPDAAEQWSLEPQGPDWERLAAALLRYKWVVLAVTLAGTALAGVATRFMRQPFQASATIWIDQSATQRANGQQLLDSEAWLDLLRSYAVLDQVVRELGLYLESRPGDSTVVRGLKVADDFRPGRYRLSRSSDGANFVLATDKGEVLERVAAGDSVGKALGIRWAPAATVLAPGASAPFALASPRDAARQLGGAIETRIDRNGNFLHVDLQGVDPKSITAIVNAVARRYVQVVGSPGTELEFAL